MTPFVSVVVPTRDRRHFIPQLLRCFRQQDYPLDRMELLVLDDGADPVGDLLEGVRGVRYLREAIPRPIGHKRNRLADAAAGDVIVHMDDDDYYPATRVSHAVRMLEQSGLGLAGSSAMHLYDVETGAMGVVGPFGPCHATAGTMAYTRAYRETHRCDESRVSGEEPAFTGNFQEPMVQLQSLKTILCISHTANTVSKRRLPLAPAAVGLKDIVKCKASLSFYRYQLPKHVAELVARPPAR